MENRVKKTLRLYLLLQFSCKLKANQLLLILDFEEFEYVFHHWKLTFHFVAISYFVYQILYVT